jgi:hypothetical protein
LAYGLVRGAHATSMHQNGATLQVSELRQAFRDDERMNERRVEYPMTATNRAAMRNSAAQRRRLVKARPVPAGDGGEAGAVSMWDYLL